MKIVAITRFKHGEFYHLLKQAGMSAAMLSRTTGISNGMIYRYLNLKRAPSQKEADLIQIALAERGVFADVFALWPETFEGTSKNKIEIEGDVDVANIPSLESYKQPKYHQLEDYSGLEAALKTLTEKQQQVLDWRYSENPMTLREIGKKLGLTKQAVRAKEQKALMRMRHPRRLGLIQGLNP